MNLTRALKRIEVRQLSILSAAPIGSQNGSKENQSLRVSEGFDIAKPEEAAFESGFWHCASTKRLKMRFSRLHHIDKIHAPG